MEINISEIDNGWLACLNLEGEDSELKYLKNFSSVIKWFESSMKKYKALRK